MKPVSLLLMLILIGCSVGMNSSSQSGDFIASGLWQRVSGNDALHYGTLEFRKDGSAIFTSAGDTLFRFSYRAESGRILLTDALGHSEVLDYRIVGADSICFPHMLDYAGEMCYTRTPLPAE